MSKAAVIKGGAEGLPTFASFLAPLTQRPIATTGVMTKTQRVEAEAAERGFEFGFNKGVEDGKAVGELKAFQAAHEAYEQELEILKTELTLITDRIEKALHAWYEASEQQMTDLVTDVAEKVVCAQLSLDRSTVLEIVRDALAEVTHSQHATIRVNPFDSPVLAQHKEELMRVAASIRSMEFVDDPQISGGAVIETDGGRVDATIEGKFEAFRAEMEVA